MVIACPSCGTENRVPSRHLSHQGRCGACKAALGPLAVPLDVDAATFDDIVSASPVPVLVDFWAPWCGPCRTVAPEVKKAAERVAGKGIVLKVDTERAPALAARYGVRGIPNFMVFARGKPVGQEVGAVGHDRLIALVAAARAAL
jgi:thioredoxin 2